MMYHEPIKRQIEYALDGLSGEVFSRTMCFLTS